MEGVHLDFSQKQQDQIQKYLDTHICDQFKNYSGGFGSVSKLQFLVATNGIGYIISIICPYCKHKVDITDIDTW